MGTTLVSSLKSQVIPFILSTVHTVHTLEPRVTVLVNVRPVQTCHTLAPRVTDLVPVRESLLCILQQSLFWSLTKLVTTVYSASSYTTVIKSLRSWSCGQRLKVIPAPADKDNKVYKTIHPTRSCLLQNVKTSYVWYPPTKKMNKVMKVYNGNIKSHNIKVMEWNIGNKKWRNKVTEVQALVNEYSPDICFITEANMHNDTPEDFRVIPGYTLEYPLTRENPTLQYSRIVAIVREGLSVKLLREHMSDDISSIWLQILRKGPKKLIVGGTYREHRYMYQNDDSSNSPAAQLARWEKTTSQWMEAGRGNDCILVGDCNVDLIEVNHQNYGNTPLHNSLENNIIANGFTQHIAGPTRFWPGCASTLVDHAWSNCSQKVINHRNLDRAASDHNVIEITVANKKKALIAQEVLMRKKMTITTEQLCEQLKEKDWTTLYETNDVDVANTILEENITSILNEVAPMVKIQPKRNNKSWITKETRQQFTERDRLRNRANTTRDDNDWELYRTARNTCSYLAKKDKRNYFTKKYEQCENQGETSKLYSITKKQLGWTTGGTPRSFQVDGKIVNSPKLLADIQNNYFVEKVEKLVSELPSEDSLPDPLEPLKKAFGKLKNKDEIEPLIFKTVTEKTVVNLIKKLKNSGTFGHDCIDTRTIKIAQSVLSKPITRIINLSISTSKFVNKWRIAKVVPLYKGKLSNQLIPKSFRPISILSVISKITEKVIQAQLVEHFDCNNLWNKNQHGYRSNRSTTTILLQIADALYSAADAKEIANILTIDESAAFDSVEVEILINKTKNLQTR